MKFKQVTLLITLVFSGISARADTVDPLIEGAKNCTRYLQHYERQYGVPLHLLSAISSTETGRYHKGLKLALPWPWTINAEGKGYFLNSKAEAIAKARQLQAQGIKSMDVGCMQVNLYHHAGAFASLDDAFDPDKNIAYAASFLRNLYQELGNWKIAAASYHSRTPSLGSEYVGKVYDKWYTIIDKLRLARTVVAAADVQAPATDTQQNGVLKIGASAIKPAAKVYAPVAAATASQLGEQTGKKLATQEPVHMKLIKVADVKPKREHGIIVVRPDIPVGSAQNAAVAAPALAPASGAGITPVSSRNTGHTALAANGPRFIFTD